MSRTKAPGYIKIHRSMLDWEWYQDDRCVRLLLHLHLKANYSTGRWKGRDVMPGEVVTSSVALADQLGWSRSAVNRTLDKLKKCGEVDTKSDNKWTLVALRKWDKMQVDGSKPDTKAESDRTATGQQTSEQPDTIKEEEEGKKKEEGKEPVTARKVLFSNSRYSDPRVAAAELADLVAKGVNIEAYAEKIRNWSDANDIRRTDRGWLATYRTFHGKDQERAKPTASDKHKATIAPRNGKLFNTLIPTPEKHG